MVHYEYGTERPLGYSQKWTKIAQRLASVIIPDFPLWCRTYYCTFSHLSLNIFVPCWLRLAWLTKESLLKHPGMSSGQPTLR